MTTTFKPSYPDYFALYDQTGAQTEAIQKRYNPLIAALTAQLDEILQAPVLDLVLVNAAQDRLMRTARRRHQENLRLRANLDSWLALRPSCSCNEVRALGRWCERCGTEARYTQQQAHELQLPPVPREAARRERAQTLYVEITCRERLQEFGTLTYEPQTGKLPTRMPVLCCGGRLWSAPLPAWAAMAQADTHAHEIFKAPLDPKFQQVLDNVQQLIQPR